MAIGPLFTHGGAQNVSSRTVETVWKDHPIGHKNVVCQDRWSLVTGYIEM